jgi:glucoside 3-dehydrogenase (cytochrome c) hitch-hiker subunit
VNRREALRLLATSVVLPLASSPMLAAMREARALVGGQGTAASPRTLNAHQGATVKAMAEMIIPRTDTPGAADVGAGEFIDLILTEWCSDEARAGFLKGLSDVDARTQTLFGKDFIDAPPLQQADILTALGEKLAEETDRAQAPRRRRASLASDNFYSMLRYLTLTAYYTSEAGATEELHFEMIPDRFEECAAMPAAKGGPGNQ